MDFLKRIFAGGVILFFLQGGILFCQGKKDFYRDVLLTIMATSKLLKISPSLLTGLIIQESFFNPYGLNIRFYLWKDYLKFKKYFRVNKKCSFLKKKIICTVLPEDKRKLIKILRFVKSRKKIDYDIGLMQINRKKLKDYGISPEEAISPEINILLGGLILKKCMEKYRTVEKALICYNRGENADISSYKSIFSIKIIAYDEYFKDLFKNFQ